MPGRADDQRTGERLTHVDEHGKAHMVDITGKAPTLRIAEARCSVRTTADVSKVLADPAVGPGLLETARFAGPGAIVSPFPSELPLELLPEEPCLEPLLLRAHGHPVRVILRRNELEGAELAGPAGPVVDAVQGLEDSQ